MDKDASWPRKRDTIVVHTGFNHSSTTCISKREGVQYRNWVRGSGVKGSISVRLQYSPVWVIGPWMNKRTRHPRGSSDSLKQGEQKQISVVEINHHNSGLKFFHLHQLHILRHISIGVNCQCEIFRIMMVGCEILRPQTYTEITIQEVLSNSEDVRVQFRQTESAFCIIGSLRG